MALISALTDFKQYMNLLEAIMPSEAKAIRKTVALVEADVSDAIQADTATADTAGEETEEETLQDYLARLTERFPIVINRLENKFGPYKFNFFKKDFVKEIDKLNELASAPELNAQSLGMHAGIMKEMIFSLVGQTSNRNFKERYAMFNDDDEIGGAYSEVSSALTEIVALLDQVETVADTAQTAEKEKPENTVDYWYDQECARHKAKDLLGIVLRFQKDLHTASRARIMIEHELEKGFGKKISQGTTDPVTYKITELNNGFVLTIDPTDPDDSGSVAKAVTAIKHALDPEFVKNATLFVNLNEIPLKATKRPSANKTGAAESTDTGVADAQNTVAYWYNEERNDHASNHLPGIVVGFKRNEQAADLLIDLITRALSKTFGVDVNEDMETPFTYRVNRLPNGFVMVIDPADIDPNTVATAANAIKNVIRPNYVSDAKVFVKTHEISVDRPLSQIQGGEYTVDYQWILRAIPKPAPMVAAQARIPNIDIAMKGYAKTAADKINSLPLSELSNLTIEDISNWFTSKNALTDFIAQHLVGTINGYASNVISVNSTAGNLDNSPRKTGNVNTKNSLWAQHKGSPIKSVSSIGKSDFMSRF